MLTAATAPDGWYTANHRGWLVLVEGEEVSTYMPGYDVGVSSSCRLYNSKDHPHLKKEALEPIGEWPKELEEFRARAERTIREAQTTGKHIYEDCRDPEKQKQIEFNKIKAAKAAEREERRAIKLSAQARCGLLGILCLLLMMLFLQWDDYISSVLCMVGYSTAMWKALENIL